MSELLANQLKRKIARQFCRVALWIDDDIPGLGEKTDDFPFQEACDGFANDGVICQLNKFPRSVDNGVIEKYVALAKNADVLIIDWFLKQKDANSTKKIIKELFKPETGTRFIYILSKDRDAAQRELLDEWGDLLNVIPTTDCHATKYGQFVCCFDKNKFVENPEKLVDTLLECLTQAYPDYLRWAALEIAGKIKESIPNWLKNLPPGTDWGLLAERKHDPKSDTRHAVFENLFEDLKFNVDHKTIEILGNELLEKPEQNPDYKNSGRIKFFQRPRFRKGSK